MLKQGNLNPEIEEKLLNLQRYQEKQMKGEPFDASNFSTSSHASRNITSPDDFDDDNSRTSSTKVSKRRRDAHDASDDEWVLDTPKKRGSKYDKSTDRERKRDYLNEFKKTIGQDNAEKNESPQVIVKTETPINQIKKNIILKNVGDSSKFNVVVTPTSDPIKNERMNLVKREIRMKAARDSATKIVSPDDPMKQTKLHVSAFLDLILNSFFYIVYIVLKIVESTGKVQGKFEKDHFEETRCFGEAIAQ